MQHITSWQHFDVFQLNILVKGHVLACVVWYSLEHYNLIAQLDIPEDKLFNFLAVLLPSLGTYIEDAFSYSGHIAGAC